MKNNASIVSVAQNMAEALVLVLVVVLRSAVGTGQG